MKLSEYLLNPGVEFNFVNLKFLFDDFFQKPFPKNILSREEGVVTLANYFYLKKLDFLTKHGKLKERMCIIADKSFHLAYKKEKVDALVTLIEFLKHFNLPIRNYIMQVKKHEDVPFSPELSPLSVYYKEPALPVIDKESGKVHISLEQNFFSKVFYYQTGKNVEVPLSPPVVGFPCSTFCGLSLHKSA